MKILSPFIILVLLTSNSVIAEKPEWARKGKPTKEQLKAHKASMNAKESVEHEQKKMEGEPEKLKGKTKEKKKKLKPSKDKASDMKGKAKKPDVQEKINQDKSSEKAKEVRKKWWQFF